MIKLLLKSKQKKTKDGKKKFRTYFTDVMIVVKGEESKGKQRKTITVRFDKDCPNTKNLVRGYITVDEKDVDMPYKWQIVKKDDKDSYPSIYIRKFENYEEVKGKSTIEFLLDEDETEETVIDESAIEEAEEGEFEDVIEEETEELNENSGDEDLPF